MELKKQNFMLIVLALLFICFIVYLSFTFQDNASTKNLQIVKSIAEEYHKTHTYSKPDLFVCGDMAIDVWNQVKSRGINAQIAVGNIENPNANFTEFNHAWVLAETTPFKWLALETTGGYLVWGNDSETDEVKNDLYYKGYIFDNPKEFKEYLELMKNYNKKLTELSELRDETLQLGEEYDQELAYYDQLVNEYNQKYAGKPIISIDFNAAQQLQDKITNRLAILKEKEGRVNQLLDTSEKKAQELIDIINQISGLLT